MTEPSFFSSRPRLYYFCLVILWLSCISMAGQRLYHARTEFSNATDMAAESMRADGNYGHTTIDFGGQWLMGRMLVVGNGRKLYHRQAQWPVAWAAYPIEDESLYLREQSFPAFNRPPGRELDNANHDAEALLSWLMGEDHPDRASAHSNAVLSASATGPWAVLVTSVATHEIVTPSRVEALNVPSIGGPLYPPVHAMAFAPLALTNDPRTAYIIMQYFSVLLTFLAGWCFARITSGRVWWPLAVLCILAFPGFRSGLDLGQNQIVTLTLLLAGWLVLLQKRPYAAGIIWGLLAFKPVWSVTFLMVPLLLGQWRMVLAMYLTAGVWILASLPLVGIQTWFDWLAVGREATTIYEVNENWIGLSRDLSGIIRRPLLDISLPYLERSTPHISFLCKLVPSLFVVLSLCVFFFNKHDGALVGKRAGTLALSAYLCCFHFMYYDAMIAAFPLALLAGTPRGFCGRSFEMIPIESRRTKFRFSLASVASLTMICLIMLENYLMQLALAFSISFGFMGRRAEAIGGMPSEPPRLTFDTTIYTACDTIILLVAWAVLSLQLIFFGSDTPEHVER